VARYGFGKTRLGVIYEQLKYEQQNSVAAATAFQSYSRNAYAFTATHEIGPGTFRGLYARAQSGNCSLAGGGECSPADWERGSTRSATATLSRRGPICTGFTLASPMIPTQPTSSRTRRASVLLPARRTSAICLACGTRSDRQVLFERRRCVPLFFLHSDAYFAPA